MTTPRTTTNLTSTAPRLRARRRGVSSVLAMMFMVIFGSLAAAMAVVAQGNMRTAGSSLRVSRAMSAAETGLVYARNVLESEGRRFIIEKGNVDTTYAYELWTGDYDEGADGAVDIEAPDAYTLSGDGLVHAVSDYHENNASHNLSGVMTGDSSWPSIDGDTGTLRVQAIELSDQGADGAYFILKYQPVAGGPYIRVTSQGWDGDISRTLQMDFKIGKKIEFAILSPNRIMIGKNVRIEGPLGSRYGVYPPGHASADDPNPDELDGANADPLVMRSDFYYLDTNLDALLDIYFDEVADHDVDGDNRLRPGHPTENAGLTNAALVDYNGDEFVDDYDLFLDFYDANNDKMVLYDTVLAGAAGISGSEEFTVDLQLANLIDSAHADRDGDGDEEDASDVALGYMDGVIDEKDRYGKVHGRLTFAVTKAAWETAHGDAYQTVTHGPLQLDLDENPVEFAVGSDEMRELTTDMFNDSQNWFAGQVSDNFGDTSSGQVQQNLSAGGSAQYVAAGGNWEAVPYGADGAYDHYDRQIYRNMTFTNVVIPEGNNGLFENCVFKGVTYIEAHTDNEHENWNLAGALEEDADTPGTYNLRFEPLVASNPPEVNSNPVLDTRPYSNNIRFHDCIFIGSLSGDKIDEYTHWRNKIQFTGETRFYIEADDDDIDDDNDTTTATMIKDTINNFSAGELDQLRRSSILMAGWSLDIGSFDNATPAVKLKGTIVSGIMDVRGTVDVHGTILSTFRPEDGEGPLFYGGQTEAFNTTIGYFDAASGGLEGASIDDIKAVGFGEITLRYDPDALLPDGIPWPIFIEPETSTYVEGGSL